MVWLVLEIISGAGLLLGGGIAALALGAFLGGAQAGMEGRIAGNAIRWGTRCFGLCLFVLIVSQRQSP